jgi:hypothetical protein
MGDEEDFFQDLDGHQLAAETALSLATSFGPLWPRDLAHQSNKTG